MLNPAHITQLQIQTSSGKEIQVLMDVFVYLRPDEQWGAEYDCSEPYLLQEGKRTKVIGLTSDQIMELQEQAHELANCIHSAQNNPSYEPADA